MNIVAIYNLSTDEESLSKALAIALGKTAYEARSRVHVPRGGPSVVGVFRETGQAEESASKLRANGFKTIILSEKEIESDSARCIARSFSFIDRDFSAESREGKTVSLPYQEIRLLLYGSGMSVQTGKETVTERKFNLAKAIATQGLSMTSKTTREIRTEEHNRERFLYLSVPGQPTLVLRENAILFDSLGKALQPSRAANFNFVVEELRRRCPAAVFDDRLLSRGNQVQLLGPLLTPEADLDIATTLLARVLQSP